MSGEPRVHLADLQKVLASAALVSRRTEHKSLSKVVASIDGGEREEEGERVIEN